NDFRTGTDVLLFSAALTGGLTVAQTIFTRFAQLMDNGLLFDFGQGQQVLLAGVTRLTNPAADIIVYDLG
ncbi:MAG: hypothetical protein C0427_05770, partial [Rhodobacter sp.]|nr:hypothetical protein [Rhodobacter sp.]